MWTGETNKAGRDYLEQRSTLGKKFQAMNPPSDILVVEDSPADARQINSALRILFGLEVVSRTVASINALNIALKDRLPDLVFLDDQIDTSRAETTVPVLRNGGYTGPIVAISGFLTRTRVVELMRLGIVDIIHKDSLDSSRLREAVLKAMSGDFT